MEIQEIKERMNNGKLYYCDNEALVNEQLKHLEMLYDFNETRPLEQDKRKELLKNMFAEIGENCYIEPPLRANWGGKNVHFGNGVYANFNLTLVDDCDIFVGNNVMIAPNVIITTGTHPIHPGLRSKQAQYNLPVHIGNNVWIGAGAIILPGVKIGDNTVIGAGSIVTKDIPANVVALGSPCKVFRDINENDMKYYNKNMEIDID
ncbi:Galactoside O-acetyltransferase [uncultured Clostridium sp.]|uniref:sugar O-acetyltransferase n=1 Tax=uncultured Clostridium sp. TaxID=59620 RepID=UPI000822064C|nr:sugar O-acetyltransferase [uncultured Clostridium sp.]SCJ99915.1 Galactoside O-acetyltransferase [uncultured Clostridium sp.]